MHDAVEQIADTLEWIACDTSSFSRHLDRHLCRSTGFAGDMNEVLHAVVHALVHAGEPLQLLQHCLCTLGHCVNGAGQFYVAESVDSQQLPHASAQGW